MGRPKYKANRPRRPENSRERLTAYERRKRERARERWWNTNRPPKAMP